MRVSQALEQSLMLGGADKAREGIEDQQQLSHFGARRHVAIGLGVAPGAGPRLQGDRARADTPPALHDRATGWSIGRRCWRPTSSCSTPGKPRKGRNRLRRRRTVVRRSCNASSSVRQQPRLTAQQPYFQADDMSHQPVNQRRHHLLLIQMALKIILLPSERSLLASRQQLSGRRGIRECRNAPSRLCCCSLRTLRIAAESWPRSAATTLWSS